VVGGQQGLRGVRRHPIKVLGQSESGPPRKHLPPAKEEKISTLRIVYEGKNACAEFGKTGVTEKRYWTGDFETNQSQTVYKGRPGKSKTKDEKVRETPRKVHDGAPPKNKGGKIGEAIT